MYARQIAEAKTVLKEALAIDSKYYAAHLLLALIALGGKHPKEALGHLTQVKLLADNPSYQCAFAWCWKLVEDWPEEEKQAWAVVVGAMQSMIAAFPGPLLGIE
jgi:hypothetical protein